MQNSKTAVEMPLWTHEGSSRIPFWAYTNPEVYERELHRISIPSTGTMSASKPKFPITAISSARPSVNAPSSSPGIRMVR
jgi:hypothetical protein